MDSHNRHLRTALDQALILHDARDFDELADSRRFVDQVVGRRNRCREQAVRIEAAALRPLPARRTVEPEVRLRRNRLHRDRRARHPNRRLPGAQRLLQRAAAWDTLSAALPRRDACRRLVDLLWLAHEETCEAELAALIAEDIAAGRLPDGRVVDKPVDGGDSDGLVGEDAVPGAEGLVGGEASGLIAPGDEFEENES